MKRPNVLLLYTDQQRWDTIRYGGNPHIITPNLDRLAEGGVLFENTFCNTPMCMPSRQSMLSGLYPSTVGCCSNGVEMPEEVDTIWTLLKPYGYHTANIGKLHFKNHSNRDHRIPHPKYGFDTLVLSEEPGCYNDAYIKWVEQQDPAQVENCRCDTPPAWMGKQINVHPRAEHQPYVFDGPENLTHSAFVASETVRYIQQHKHEPFFCIAAFYAPHSPINPPQRFVDMYDPNDMPLPIKGAEENRFGLSDDDFRKIKQYYYALVTHVDDQIGRILSALDEVGVADNTVVIFTADHGETLGDHGTFAKDPPGFDSCSHVPLIVSFPKRIEGGGKKRELIEHVDIAPTILDYCGVHIPPSLQGRSFRSLIEGNEYQERTSAFIEFHEPFGISWKTVRTHDHKYCVANSGEELLFDLRNDPGELNNVVANASYSDALNSLRNELVRRWFTVEKQYPMKTGVY